jgi:hypothetical protein
MSENKRQKRDTPGMQKIGLDDFFVRPLPTLLTVVIIRDGRIEPTEAEKNIDSRLTDDEQETKLFERWELLKDCMTRKGLLI